jgi:hypothetical protein
VAKNNDDETVETILSRKKASVKNAPLISGSPSWDDILDETWAEVVRKAKQRVPGYRTFRKLLTDPGYNK